MIRRHFFLAGAIAVVLLMVVAGALRLTVLKGGGGDQGGQGGPSAAAGRGGHGGGPGGPGGGGATVTPAVVEARTFTDRLEVLGVAKGRQSVTLTSNATELVTGVRFRDGQAVAKGQVLVDLQAREEDAAVAQAEAALGLAQTTYARWQALDAKGFAPKQTLDQYKAQLVQAQAALAAAKSRRLDRAIRAPFSGVVGLSDVAPGALINPGTPIVSLDDIAVIRVDFDIPDRFLSTLHPGSPITATSDSYPSVVFRGSIAQLDTRVNEQTRAIRARAEFPNPGARLRPGMLIKVSIDQGSRQALAAPEAAVQFSADQPYVYVIANRGGRTVAEQRPVATGANENGYIEIRDGLAGGEQIVADGLNKVQPNSPVRLATSRPPRPPGAKPAATAQVPARNAQAAPPAGAAVVASR
ncbi:MAG TPA: efflux RND transporter periplasmic adaptor subunit [Caulobacteraceae bacterium]|nr:efflux RND transporter periplasmic adaptor subunit [Caulobacteraceae bacterium]